MKLTTLTLATLIALSTTASAEWMDGNTKADATGSSAATTDAATTGKGEGTGKTTGNAKGWGTGRGDADGAIDFAINLKAKGRTNMDTKMSGEGNGDAQGTTTADAVGTGNSTGNMQGSSMGYSDSNASATPWNNQNRPYPYPMAQMPMNIPQIPAAQAPQRNMPQPMPQGYMQQGYMPQNYVPNMPMMQNMPMMYNPYGNYAPAPMPMNGYRQPMPMQAQGMNPYQAQAAHFQQVQQRMEAQRAQAEAFFKKMDEQRKAQLTVQHPKNTAVAPAEKQVTNEKATEATAEAKPETNTAAPVAK